MHHIAYTIGASNHYLLHAITSGAGAPSITKAPLTIDRVPPLTIDRVPPLTIDRVAKAPKGPKLRLPNRVYSFSLSSLHASDRTR